MIKLERLTKTFTGNDGVVQALNNINLTINDGDIYGIIGMSGAGKSTLVRCINMLERPTWGKVWIDDKEMGSLSEKELRKVRSRVAMIFQSFNLLMQRNCLDNICFPLELAGVSRTEAQIKARQLLRLVGLPDKEASYPAQLSGGQQQRIAIARALATNPKVLLCDEATSALDPQTTHSILSLIKKIHSDFGITVIVITHQMSVVEEICNRVAILDNGSVVEEGEVSKVFSSPKSRAAKNLVYPDHAEVVLNKANRDRLVRVIFDGAPNATRPVITQMAMDEHIAANILYASTRGIEDIAYGNMILGLPSDQETFERALAYLRREEGVLVEELVDYE